MNQPKVINQHKRFNMTDETIQQDVIINSEAMYSAALDIVIEQAKQTLKIFDQDLSVGAFNSVKRYELLLAFLNNNPASKLTIVLQDTRFFLTKCPRLFDLLKTYGHKMVVYETNSHAKIAKDCFILADHQRYIRRFHIDQARFKYALADEATTDSLDGRFEELLEATTQTVSTTKLGL